MERLGPTRRGRMLRHGGQHLVEYAIIIGVAATTAIGMQTYVKRALQAKVKGQVDYWLNVQAASLSPPEECVEAGITDPAECTQRVGMVLQDVEKLVERAGRETEISKASRVTNQRTTITYTPGEPVSSVTLNNDGTSFRVTGTADSLTQNSLPPDFVRRPQLPNGIPTGVGGMDIRSRTPPVIEVSGAASAQRAAELGKEQQRKKDARDEEGESE